MYAKAHPFGYIPVKKRHEGRPFTPKGFLQKVKMKDGSVRTIQHYKEAHRGRTLADMVYESFLSHFGEKVTA